jgi:hypothetical protein
MYSQCSINEFVRRCSWASFSASWIQLLVQFLLHSTNEWLAYVMSFVCLSAQRAVTITHTLRMSVAAVSLIVLPSMAVWTVSTAIYQWSYKLKFYRPDGGHTHLWNIGQFALDNRLERPRRQVTIRTRNRIISPKCW